MSGPVIIGIHGLANKPPLEKKPGWWREAIIEGLQRNCNKTNYELDFDFVYWANLCYDTPDTDTDEPYLPADGTGRLPEYRIDKWDIIAAAAADVIGDAADYLKNKYGIGGVANVALDRVMQDLWDYYNGAPCRAKEYTKPVITFRDTVRDQLAAALLKHKGRRIMLVAHSMGSIIAYDTLRILGRKDPDFRVDHFVTIGSPLGLPHVKHKIWQENDLVRTPSCVRRWTNFADHRDPVAADPYLADDYEANDQGVKVVDVAVINSYLGKTGKPNHHKSYGYLRAPELSDLVRAFY